MNDSYKFDKSNLATITNPKALIERAAEQPRRSLSIASIPEIEIHPDYASPRVNITPQQSEIENSQRIYRQQQLIESLTHELAQNQQRVTELEQLLQESDQHNNRQARQLQTLEAICQDLRSCLQRQRQQTLEFKAAVEKCMIMTGQSPEAEMEREFCILLPPELTLDQQPAPSRLSRPTAPIRPWQATTTSTERESSPVSSLKPPSSRPQRSRSQVQLPSFHRA